MRNDLTLTPWIISTSSDCWHDDFLESVFFLGNGRMGMRGYLPFEEDPRPIQKGMYIAGIYGEIKAGITDLVHMSAPSYAQLMIDGAIAMRSTAIRYEMDLQRAVLSAQFTMSADGKNVDITYQRFFPKEHTGLMMQRITCRSASACTLTLHAGLLTASCNCPIPDDQVKSNTETVILSPLEAVTEENGLFSGHFSIVGNDLHVTETCDFHSHDFTSSAVKQEYGKIYREMQANCQADGACTLDWLSYISTSRDVDPRITMPSQDWSYEDLLQQHIETWQEIWQKCDFLLPFEGDELQIGLRYAMFHLMGSCSSHDDTVSIGARGLSHGRYKGCYFWDTDVFMLPFFIQNDMTAAKNLCAYRANALPAARAYAKAMNAEGARYPWMASLDGSEQCETWDIGCSELHITADVVYAIDQYCKTARDEDFYLCRAAEIYVETARFWMSRYTYHAETDTADLLFCKGPDEYCGITNNNLYTNVLVQHNLRLAQQAAQDLKEKCPDTYQRLQITEDEVRAWEHLREIIPWPRDPITGHLTTDDTFHLLERVDISLLKQDDGASYHHVCFDRLQRYKVVKQADVLLLMSRFPELFSDEEKLTAWKDFEPICLHDSTLSFASHALFAFQNGLKDEGLAYLRKALLLDLRDVMGNTGSEGLHLACMGEAWQAAMTAYEQHT